MVWALFAEMTASFVDSFGEAIVSGFTGVAVGFTLTLFAFGYHGSQAFVSCFFSLPYWEPVAFFFFAACVC